MKPEYPLRRYQQHPGMILSGSEIKELEAKWKKPVVLIGMPVMWYPSPRHHKCKYGILIGHNKIKNRSTILVPEENRVLPGSIHVSDPCLLGRQGQQTNQDSGGCWDHTEYHHRTVRFIADLEERVAKLEKKLAMSKPSTTPSQKAAVAQK